jgi:hypothetical protein
MEPISSAPARVHPGRQRPNTVAGLVAKRDELIKLRDKLDADLRARHPVDCTITINKGGQFYVLPGVSS